MLRFSTMISFLVVLLSLRISNSITEDNQIGTIEMDSTGNQHQTNDKPRSAIRRRPTSQPTAVGIKIKNSRKQPLDYYWFNGKEGQFQGRLHPRGVTATNSYEGHIFYVTPMKRPEEELFRFQVTSEENLYLVPPYSETEMKTNPNVQLSEDDEAFWNQLLEEKEFMQSYKQRTGRPWLAHYPRDPPILPMWAADYVGQIHTVSSNNTYWTCIPDDIESYTLSQARDISDACRVHEPISIDIEVINTEPKVYLIKNTLSEVETDLIVSLAEPKIHRSLAGQDGGMVSNTRTSYNTWLSRKTHPILDTVYRRAGDILEIDQTLLEPNRNVEELQVLNYQIGQEYTSHHDFGASGRPEQRFITLLYYLNDQITPNAGGETAFPKAVRNDSDAQNEQFKIHPGKGNSVLFYSMLEDGNADDLSLHAALPVKEGEKWLCNFWVWDPHR